MDHCVCNGTTLVDARRADQLLVHLPAARGDLRPPRVVLRRAPDGLGRPHRRPGCTTCRPTSWRSSRAPPRDHPAASSTTSRSWSTRTASGIDRSVGIAAISGEDAINWGWTGPCLRASGVAYDVRRAHPYDLYDTLDWDVPVLEGGDVYDRYRVRMMEIRAVAADHPAAARPRHARRARASSTIRTSRCRRRMPAYNQMEVDDLSLQADHGRHPGAAGRALLDGRRGQRRARLLLRLSDGTGQALPHASVRPPCFPIFSTFPTSDQRGIALRLPSSSLGGLNIIAGELER